MRTRISASRPTHSTMLKAGSSPPTAGIGSGPPRFPRHRRRDLRDRHRGIAGTYGGDESYVAEFALIGETFADPTGITLDQGNGSILGDSGTRWGPRRLRLPGRARPGWSPSIRPT